MYLTILIENTGDAEAKNIHLTVNTPSELQTRTSLTDAYAPAESVIKWDEEELRAGEVHIIKLSFTAPEEPKEDLEFPMSLSWEDQFGNEWLMEFILSILLEILRDIIVPMLGIGATFAALGIAYRIKRG